MASLVLTPENQIQRLNHIFGKVKNLQGLPSEKLTDPPQKKAWSIIEIIEHLINAYSFYENKIEVALKAAPDAEKGSWSFKARPWQRFVIESQRPKGTVRKWKMKTLKRFEPLIDRGSLTQEKTDTIFDRFLTLYGQLKASIVVSRSKDMKQQRFTSAVGPIVRFYLPEAFEFLICHAERHMVQIDDILA